MYWDLDTDPLRFLTVLIARVYSTITLLICSLLAIQFLHNVVEAHLNGRETLDFAKVRFLLHNIFTAMYYRKKCEVALINMSSNALR